MRALALFVALLAPAVALAQNSAGYFSVVPVLVTSGNLTSDGTEQTLASSTTAPGCFWAEVNASNMADGDTIELRVYSKANANDTEAQVYFASFSNTQNDKIKVSPEICTIGDYKFTLKRTAGSDRTYQWGAYQR